MMATASKGTMSFSKACSGSKIKRLQLCLRGGFGLPGCRDVLFRRLSIQLSLGGLLSSRAHLCFTGHRQSRSWPHPVNSPEAALGLGPLPEHIFLRSSAEDAQAQQTTISKHNRSH